MITYLAPFVALIGLFLYFLAGAGSPEKPVLSPKLGTIGLIMFAAGLLATLLKMGASAFGLR